MIYPIQNDFKFQKTSTKLQTNSKYQYPMIQKTRKKFLIVRFRISFDH